MDLSLAEETKEEPKKPQDQLSKKQLKKLKRAEKWEEVKKLKKQKKKEEKEQKKQAKSSLNAESEPVNDQVPTIKKRITKTQKQEHRLAVQNAQPIVIDLSFQPLMTDKEIKSLCLQLAYCHSVNRKFQKKAQIVFSSCKGSIKERLLKTNANTWGVLLNEKHYLDDFQKDKLVYLTGDAEEELDELDEEFAFAINFL